ncbi:unnamed protein product [Tetraodon nigroviridis]|uniref:Elongator complex protein 6 n=1 Tax=Tetraodon nigroviridis TaxID=99883 RepID=Q4TD65_TETNG|nr:unnamed protein product [Tetraodon nigroviridis]
MGRRLVPGRFAEAAARFSSLQSAVPGPGADPQPLQLREPETGCESGTSEGQRSAGVPGGPPRVTVGADSSGAQSSERTMDFLRHADAQPDPAAGLRSLYECVGFRLSGGPGGDVGETWGPPVVLVDDLSVLLSLGVSAGAVLDFSHYCRATVCSRLRGNVVMLTRCDGGEEEDEGDDEGPENLVRGLTHQCSLALRVQGLPTGFCRDIHGQVEVCWRRRQSDGQLTPSKVFQYKVHDKGASFFARGTSSAVL